MNAPTDADRAERPTARAAAAGDGDVATRVVERTTRDSDEPALYSVEDRRQSGEWRVVAETRDVHEARRISLLIRWAGGESRVQLIPTPIIP